MKLSGRDAVIRCQDRRRRRVGGPRCLRALAMVLAEMFKGIATLVTVIEERTKRSRVSLYRDGGADTSHPPDASEREVRTTSPRDEAV